MAYSDFTLYDLEEKFGVKHERKTLVFSVLPIKVSERLKLELAESVENAYQK